MSDARLPINYWDNWRVARDKINDSFNDVVATVAWYRPHIESWIWWIWNTNTGVKAVWDSIDMKVESWYIRYKSESRVNWTQIIAIADLKWDKGDTWDKGDKWDKGDTWSQWPAWASICAAAFSGNDMVFTKDNWCTVTLTNAKSCLKWDKWDTGATGCQWPQGETWPQGCQWIQWETWATGARICAAAFSGDDLVFTETDSNTVTITGAKVTLTWPQGETGQAWATWATGNWISCVTTSKSWKTTTVTMNYTSWEPTVFCVQDWADGSGSGDMCSNTYDPTSKMADAFDYCNMYNTPTIPTDNCQLANGCWFTTCTGTVVAADLTPYTKSCTLCTVATSGKYCDLTWKPTIPTDNCQLANWCGYTTCTWTVVAWDLTPYAKTCALCTVATSGKYCDLSWKPTIPTDNSQLANGCGYTTCTGTVSSCADVISALGYTPYNSSNPSWYTTCTWTLTNSSLVTVNGCCLVWSGDVTISWLPAWWTDWQIIMMVGWNPTWVTPTSCGFIMDAGWPTKIKYIWAWCQDCYDNLWSYDENTHYDTY